MNSVEFPHSEISGSKDVCSSPKLIAAYHVFHRLPVPRHSPCALCSLTVVYLSINISYFRFSICQRDFTILLSLIAKLQFRLVKLQILIKIRNFTQLIKSHFAVLYSVFKVHRIKDLWVALTGNLWWAEMDSNHRPLGYQPSALTS